MTRNESPSDGPSDDKRRSLREHLSDKKNRAVALSAAGLLAVTAALVATQGGEGETKPEPARTVQLGGQESARVVEASKRIVANLGSLSMAAREGALSPDETFTASVEVQGQSTRLTAEYTGPQPEEPDGRSHVLVSFDVPGARPDVDSALTELGGQWTPYPAEYGVDSTDPIGEDGDVGFKLGTNRNFITAADLLGNEADATDAIVGVDVALGAEAAAAILEGSPTLRNAG